jgi:single-stranded DNA-binding protein
VLCGRRFDVEAWEELAERVAAHVTTGKRVLVKGTLKTETCVPARVRIDAARRASRRLSLRRCS